MTLREQLSQAMTAREASASDLLTVTERCRMLENTLATFASQSGPGSAGSLAELQMENELLAKEVHTLRFGYVPGKPRFAARGVVEGKTTWLDKWAAMLDDASRKITGAGPVASTLLVGIYIPLNRTVLSWLTPDAPVAAASHRGVCGPAAPSSMPSLSSSRGVCGPAAAATAHILRGDRGGRHEHKALLNSPRVFQLLTSAIVDRVTLTDGFVGINSRS